MDKIGIFIDGGYLAKILEHEHSSKRIDLGKLQDKMKNHYDLFRTYYYICPPFQSTTPTDDEKTRLGNYDRFIYNLHKIPHFEIRQGILIETRDSFQQKRIDVMLAVDMVRTTWNRSMHRAAIIAGDGDFVPVINDIKNAGVIVCLYYSENAISKELLDVCDERTRINEEFINSIRLNH